MVVKICRIFGIIVLVMAVAVIGIRYGYNEGVHQGENQGELTGYETGYDVGYSRGQYDELTISSYKIEEIRTNYESIIDSLEEQIANLSADDFIPWYSIEEVQWWLANNDISRRDYQVETYDCDNFARDLAVTAASENRLIGIYRDYIGASHLMNFVIIGNKLYKIEPQSDEITYDCKIDSSFSK